MTLKQKISNQIEVTESLIIEAGNNELIVSELLNIIDGLENCLEELEKDIRNEGAE